MSPFWIDVIGFVAATLTTLAFVPQAIKVVRSRDTRSISRTMYSVFVVGIGCWLAYGVLLDSWPMIIANTITFALASAILIMKLRFG